MNQTEAQLNSKKSRLRVPTVCTVCRRRKMKCDKLKPHCTSCVKNRTTHLCHYEEQPWASDNELQKLKEQVFLLQQQNSELKGLLNKRAPYTGDEMDATGLILPDEPSNDPFLELTENFDLMMMKENKISHYGSSSYMATASQDPVLWGVFRQFMDTQMSGINFEKFFLYDQGILPFLKGGCAVMGPGQLASVFEKDIKKDHDELINTINSLLPQRNVLVALIDHFFAEAYAFLPFIDETAFRKNLESLVSSSPDGQALLVLNSTSQLVTISILLCILRFSFITLPLKKVAGGHNAVIQTILDSHVTVPPTYVEYAKACIANASVLRKPSLKHIQALLLLRLYRSFAPEDGDESTDSTIFLALIVQMAKMHGMHRDPSRFSLITDRATPLVWRKIWVQLMHLDAAQALLFGCPLLIDDEYDTELPVASSQDSALEKTCIVGLLKMNEVTQLMRGLVKSVSTIKSHPKRSDIERLLKTVELTISKFRPLSELMDLNDPMESFLQKTAKIKAFGSKLHLYQLHAVFTFILMLTCEHSEFAAYQKYSQMTIESSLIVFRVCYLYTKDLPKYTGSLNFECFQSTFVFEPSNRALQHIISFCFREIAGSSNIGRAIDNFTFPDSIGLKEWLAPFSPELTISDQLILRHEELVYYCSKLAPRYFLCWRMMFMHEMFTVYFESQYPGKLASLHIILEDYKRSQDGSTEEVELNLAELLKLTEDMKNSQNQVGEIWSQLLDDATDYLEPKADKFEGIDPFFNATDFGKTNFSFQDFDSMMATESAMVSRGGIPVGFPPMDGFNNPHMGQGYDEGGFIRPVLETTSNSVSGTDDISPRTDDSLDNNRSSRSDAGQNTQQKPVNPEIALAEDDLAFQIAKSMFGGSNADFF